MATDFTDQTPAPNPAPKKVRAYRERSIAWTAGQTFQQALVAAVPAAVRSATNAYNATIQLDVVVKED